MRLTTMLFGQMCLSLIGRTTKPIELASYSQQTLGIATITTSTPTTSPHTLLITSKKWNSSHRRYKC
jgi:hypothetical protein